VKPLRDRSALLLLGFLALLLTLLALLQYRWIGEVGRAEGERLRANLEGSAGASPRPSIERWAASRSRSGSSPVGRRVLPALS